MEWGLGLLVSPTPSAVNNGPAWGWPACCLRWGLSRLVAVPGRPSPASSTQCCFPGTASVPWEPPEGSRREQGALLSLLLPLSVPVPALHTLALHSRTRRPRHPCQPHHPYLPAAIRQEDACRGAAAPSSMAGQWGGPWPQVPPPSSQGRPLHDCAGVGSGHWGMRPGEGRPGCPPHMPLTSVLPVTLSPPRPSWGASARRHHI